MKYKIDDHTPIPAPQRGKPKSRKLSVSETLRDMEVDLYRSFLVPLKGRKLNNVRGAISSSIWYVRQQFPERKYITRYRPKEKGIRVWRVA